MPALAWLNDQLVARADADPAAWLINLLNERGIRFVMRCDTASGGWRALRKFMRGDPDETMVTLGTPDAQDTADWGCSANAPTVRLVRSASTGAQLRVLLTDLGADQVPAAAFGDPYHQRWRIEGPSSGCALGRP